MPTTTTPHGRTRVTFRPYRDEPDFLRVRQFLIDTFPLWSSRPYNWLLDRWNMCRYFVLPLHTYWTVGRFGIPRSADRPTVDQFPLWESTVGGWENEAGEIVAVVNSENEEPGEAWIQMHPNYGFLYPELVDHAEAHLAERWEDQAYVKLHVVDGSALEAVVRQRGYRRLARESTTYLEYTVTEAPAPELPAGFSIRSVAEEDDVEKRRRAKAIAFGGHYCPSHWGPASAFREWQRAPDYRPELDLNLVAPDGEYASFCTIWLDEANRYAIFEPVGTQAHYQGQGLGRLLLQEGFRRMAQHGATRSFMLSGNPFYRKVGFVPTPVVVTPWIRYFAA